MSETVVRPEIYISVRHKRNLEDEFKTSRQSVRLSLCYVNNSPLAKRIRRRALAMLENEVAAIIKREPNIKNGEG